MAKTQDPSSPSTDTEKSSGKSRRFTAAYAILIDGKLVAPGKSLMLTEEQHAEAFAVAAVIQPWSKPAADE